MKKKSKQSFKRVQYILIGSYSNKLFCDFLTPLRWRNSNSDSQTLFCLVFCIEYSRVFLFLQNMGSVACDSEGDDVQIVEEVFVVDVVSHNEIPQDQFDKIVVIGENIETETTETCLENQLQNFRLQDHDYTSDSYEVSF